jgi:hypothetical protein
MANLKDLFVSSENNFNDLKEVYKYGENKTGKTTDQLFSIESNMYQIEEACKIDSANKFFPNLLRLRKGFHELLVNNQAIRIIGAATHYNFYKVNDIGITRVITHISEQIEKIDFTLSLLDNTYHPNNISGIDNKSIIDSFYVRLNRLCYDDERIFDEDVEFDVFKRQISSFLKKDFKGISPELTFRVKEGNRFIAYYVITKLANFAGIINNFTGINNVIISEIKNNGEIQSIKFNKDSRSNAIHRQVDPKLSDSSLDREFIKLVNEIEELQVLLAWN